MKISELRSLEDLRGSLRHQAETKWKAGMSRQYLASDGKKELGLLIVETPLNRDFLAVCKVFVVPESRHNGVGSALMFEAERLARSQGKGRLRLRPEPFDGTLTRAQLLLWYSNLGYTTCADNKEELEKVL